MKMKLKAAFKYIFILVTLLFISCMNDIDLKNISSDIQIDESLVFPIGEVTTDLSQIYRYYGSTDIIEFDGDEINAAYSDSMMISFEGVKLNDDIPPFYATLNVLTPLPATIPSNQVLPLNNSYHVFNLGYDKIVEVERLDSIKIANGMIEVKISTEDIDVKPSDLIISMVIDNGTSNIIIDISPLLLNEYYEIPLPAVMLNTAGKDGIEMTLVVKTASRSIYVKPTSKIDFEIKYKTIDYDVLYGKFNTSILSLTHKLIDLNLPFAFENSLLKFANPKLNITAVSNVGATLSFQINYLEAFKNTDPLQRVTADFDGNRSINVLFDNRPFIPGTLIEQQIPQLNNSFGKLDKLFESEKYPDRLEFEFSINSNNVTEGTVDYLIKNAYIKLLLDVKIPMYFNKGSYFSITDSLLNVGSAINKTIKEFSVDTAILVFKFKNGFPLKTRLEFVDLVDSLGKPILQNNFQTEYIINSASINANGLVTKVNESVVYVRLNKTQFDDIKRMKHLKYKVTLAAENSNEKVQFTKNDKFGVKLGVFLKANTVLNLTD